MEKTQPTTFSQDNSFVKMYSIPHIKKDIIVTTIAFLFILLFVYAAASKLLDYEKFKLQLEQSPLLTAYAKYIVWLIPSLEVVVSLMLASEKFRLPGLYASFILMLLFTGYIIAITKFSEYIPCSCGGILQHMSWNQHLIFNIFINLIAVVGILQYGIQPLKKRPRERQ